MALYRTVALSFWTDAKITDDFTPEDRYFYLYLFTNPHTNLAGCYEISMKQMAIETGYSLETIEKLLERFSKIHKVVHYSRETKEVLIVNWNKYNWTSSDKFRKPLKRELENIKRKEFREYLLAIFYGNSVEFSNGYGIDTYCIDTPVTVTNTDTVSDTGRKVVVTQDQFEEFWNEYPRKKNKDAAARAWVSIKPDEETFKAIMESLKDHKARDADWIRGFGIPNADNYLFDKRWLDEVTEKPPERPTEPKKNQFSQFEQRTYSDEAMLELERKKLGVTKIGCQ